MAPVEYSSIGKGIMAPMEYTPVVYRANEKVWFCESLFSEMVIVIIKDKKYCIKDAVSIKISSMHYMKWSRVMLPAFFEEFDLLCNFFLFFPFHYHSQLVKG